MRTALLALAAVALSACAPDFTLGTFNFQMTGTDTQTAPNSSSSAVSGVGTIAITTGKTVDYVLTLAQSDTDPCVLELTQDEKTRAISINAMQKCTFNYNGGYVNATVTTGTVTPDTMKGETLNVVINYSYAGTVIGINFAGSGMRTYAGTRR
ncbi:MAG: hypothetical protein U0228_22960 [Myxococcaceae bacterium]